MNLKIANDIALVLVEAFIFLVFYITLASKKGFLKEEKLKWIIFIVFYVALTTWNTAYLPLGLHTVATLVTTILILSFVTRSNVYNAAIIIIVTGLFISIIDIVVSSVYTAVLGLDINEILQHPVYYPVFTWTSKAVQILLTLAIFLSKNEKLRINILKSNNSQYMFAVIQLFLMSLFIASIYISMGTVKDKSLYVILMAVLYVLSLILSLFDIKEREQMRNVLNRKRSLEEYVKNLEDVINVIRREKHDFMNHIQTIYAICKLGKPNALETVDNYLKRLTTDLSMSYRFYETGNDYIDGLLAIKSHTCFENDIELSVNVAANFTMAKADESDIAGIVGNILNNSIECLQNFREEIIKKIEFNTYIEKDKFYMIIANNGPEIPRHLIHAIFEKGITSKIDHADHGFGLYIARQLAAKNSGTIDVFSRPERTEFVMVFPVKEEMNANNSQCVAV